MYYCDEGVFVDTTGGNSPDTLQVHIRGQDCKHWILEEEGSDTSVHWTIHAESRIDPGDASPAIYLRNGKLSKLSGQVRANNGDYSIIVDKAANGGADTLVFDDFTMVHNKGCVAIRRLRHLMGTLEIKNSDDGPNQLPALWIGRVMDAGNFKCQMSSIDNREALRIGDASTTFHANGLYGIDCDYGEYSIQMGVTNFTFTAEGAENIAGFPTGLKAAVIEKMKGGSVRFSQCMGNIEVLEAVEATTTGNPIMYVPRTFKRYTATKAAGAAVDFICPAGDTITVS
jgi:hypothetical protein